MAILAQQGTRITPLPFLPHNKPWSPPRPGGFCCPSNRPDDLVVDGQSGREIKQIFTNTR